MLLTLSQFSIEQWRESIKRNKTPRGNPTSVTLVSFNEKIRLNTRLYRLGAGCEALTVLAYYAGEEPKIEEQQVSKCNGQLAFVGTVSFKGPSIITVQTIWALEQVTIERNTFICGEV